MLLRTVSLFLALILASILAFSQSGYRRVTARRGDNIATLLRRNRLDPNSNLRAFLALNRGKLGRHNTLIAGRKYTLPRPSLRPVAKRNVPASTLKPKLAAKPAKLSIPLPVLFGPAYSQVTVRDQQLRGAVLYVSTGHGGPDPGAIGKYGGNSLAEDEYAYDVGLRLVRALLEHGATAYMIIQDPNDGIRDQAVLKMDNDEVTYPHQITPINQLARLRLRINAVNKLKAAHKNSYQRFIGLHVDSRSIGQNIDVFFYHNSASPAGKRLAESIHKTFTARYKRAQPNRPYKGTVSTRNTLYVVRNSHAPAVFMELGNIRNTKDQRRFVVPDNRQAMANWICEGIIADYRNRR
ncbi:N-acetylmuramoyl-L-alanine amidase [Hymenobacter cavernae]|uniref:N-acetylmuramoyl-L-alanine amidase n=1 Tax=Hymenobacter cavernae TaxID=2044852 RepID=A0ABQ1UV11_9BACT|nr:N-acetylmuramoyl-L-alanine amidase [Hymenobacter cavernae]